MDREKFEYIFLFGVAFIVEIITVYATGEKNITFSIFVLSITTISLIVLFQKLHERKIDEKLIKLNEKFEDKRNLDDLKSVAEDYINNKKKYQSETESIFNCFKDAMKKMNENKIPIYSRLKYVDKLASQFQNIENYERMIYLGLINFRQWPPSVWKEDPFKFLLDMKKKANEKHSVIVTIFVYDNENEEIKNVISEHKKLGLVFGCTNAAKMLAAKQCGIFLTTTTKIGITSHSELHTFLQHPQKINFGASIAFVEESIYAKGEPFDGIIAHDPHYIQKILDSYKSTLINCNLL